MFVLPLYISEEIILVWFRKLTSILDILKVKISLMINIQPIKIRVVEVGGQEDNIRGTGVCVQPPLIRAGEDPSTESYLTSLCYFMLRLIEKL